MKLYYIGVGTGHIQPPLTLALMPCLDTQERGKASARALRRERFE